MLDVYPHPIEPSCEWDCTIKMVTRPEAFDAYALSQERIGSISRPLFAARPTRPAL